MISAQRTSSAAIWIPRVFGLLDGPLRPVLADQLRHHVAAMYQRPGPSLSVYDLLLVVDPQQVVGRGQDVLGRNRPLGREGGDLVGGTDQGARPDPRTGE